MPLILSGNVASALPTGYDVANSCRFDEAVMHITPGSEGDTQKMTLSMWVKRSELGVEQQMWHTQNGSNQATTLVFGSDDKLYFIADDSNKLITTRVFRDPSAWYHIVLAIDTTLASATNRARLYINGTEETAFGTDSAPSEDQALQWTKTTSHRIGSQADTANNAFNGYLAEVVWIDGTQYAASDFGEFDEDSPNIWKPKKVSTLTFGTNGFYLDFEASDNLGNDANGGTDLTEVSIAAADQSTDSPTNNFCTINNLSGEPGTYTFSQGNCQIASGHTSWYTKGSTMAVANGKWFWEVELDAGTMIVIMVGFHDTSVSLDGTNRWVTGSMVFYNDNGGEFRIDGVETTANYGTLTAGDILGFALNMDDKQLTLYDNGSAIATNVSIGSNINEAMPTFLTDANDVVFKANFGGCSGFTVSSAANDANGYGNFEYAPPSGYYSLCTKNLVEYG